MEKPSILYVDDEMTNLELFKSIFYRIYDVYTALSAKEGLEILKLKKITVIITDEKMPFMTGVEFLKVVHELYPEIPPHRLLTSGYSKPESIDKAFSSYKLNQFIPKPWNINDLKKIIADVIEKKGHSVK